MKLQFGSFRFFKRKRVSEMADLALNPKKAGQNPKPNKAPLYVVCLVVLLAFVGFFLVGPFVSSTEAADPQVPVATVIVPTFTSTNISVAVGSPTTTNTPAATNTPTQVPLTNAELEVLTNVKIVKSGEVGDEFVRHDLLAILASQDYLREHEVLTVFPEITIEVADSLESPVGCDVQVKNGSFVIHQNVIRCKNDRQPYQWMSSVANEVMNIYFQMSAGVDTYNEISVAQWIWIEGAAEYFSWQALLEANLVTSEQAFHTTEMEDGQVYTVNDLLNSNVALGPNKSTNIGYHFMDFLIHKDGGRQEQVNKNIQNIYGVFVYLGKANVLSEFNFKKMDEAVFALFGESQSDLFAEFLDHIN